VTHLGYPEPGEMLGPYRIVRRLGFGGMGMVFEAMEGTLNRPVALKVISSHLAEDAGFRARFVHEAQAQASVRSPHVVTVYSHGEADGRLYIATELVDGGDLGRLVQEHGAPPLATALDLIAQVASGLADAHAVGLVHRDIKPANVLLRRRQDGLQAYLADFGIARQVGAASGLTVVGVTVGTPSYMAPELHTGGEAGIQSDIYSLGCLLWAAITGAAPYAGTSDYQIVSAHLEQPVPQLRPGTPAADAVNRVLRRALAKSPSDRYSDAAELGRDLRAAALLAQRSSETAVPAQAVSQPSSRRKRGSRAGLVAAALVLLLAGGVGAAVALATTGDESADPDPDPGPGSSSAGSSTTSDPTPSGDEQHAVDSLTDALVAEGMIGEDSAGCVAEGFVAGVGLDQLIEAGFFDEDLNYIDQSQDSITPDMQGVLTSVIAGCAMSGLDTSSP
jgi:serine/threonine protein kinase